MIRKEITSLAKHSGIYGTNIIIGQAIGFFLLPVYTRYLTPSDYGVMALINVSMELIGIVVGLGIAQGMARFYFDNDNRERKNLVVSCTYWVWIVVTIGILPVMYGLSNQFSALIFKNTNYAMLFRVATISLFLGFNNNIGLLYLMLESKSLTYSIISFGQMVLVISCNIYFIVFAGTGIIGIFYSALINRAILTLVLTTPILFKLGIGFSGSLISRMLKYSFPLIFSNAFRELVNQSDKYFINYFFSPFETGIYALANKIGGSVHAIITSSFVQSFVARRFEIFKERDAKETYGDILKFYLLFIGSIGLVLAMFSQEIVRVMTTKEFYEAAVYVPMVVLAMVIFGMRYHFETGILVSKKTKYVAWVNGISAFINILLNYILIPKFKVWGALLSMNISYGTADVLIYLISQRLFSIRFDIYFILKFIGCLACFFITAFIVSNQNIYATVILKLFLLAGYFCLIIHFAGMDVGFLGRFKGRIRKGNQENAVRYSKSTEENFFGK